MSEGVQLHPLFNALLNATSAILLFMAFIAIKGGDKERHKRLMLSAFGVSSAFLVSYLIRFYMSGTTPFPGTGAAKAVYLTILFSHMALAAIVPVGAILAIAWGLKGKVASHKKLVKVVFPVWAYVSVTGVVIYAMLYHWPR
jgi:putative membrane protein